MTTSRKDLARELQALERALDEERTEVWVEIVEMDGSVSKRIYRGNFVVTHDPKSAMEEHR